jgi:hypothetical protein
MDRGISCWIMLRGKWMELLIDGTYTLYFICFG